MILFCDTSALLKLYIVETGSDAVRAQVSESEVVAVCRTHGRKRTQPYPDGHARCRGMHR